MTTFLTQGDQARVLHLLANVIKYEAVLGSNLLRLVDFVGHPGRDVGRIQFLIHSYRIAQWYDRLVLLVLLLPILIFLWITQVTYYLIQQVHPPSP